VGSIALLEKQDPNPLLDTTLNQGYRDKLQPRPVVSTQRQHRLAFGQVSERAKQNLADSTVLDFGQTFEVDRTTVLAHLERQEISRRANCVE
jgi:hypothetical protein